MGFMTDSDGAVLEPVEEGADLVDYEPAFGDADEDSVMGVGYIRGGNNTDGILLLDSQPPPVFEPGPEPV